MATLSPKLYEIITNSSSNLNIIQLVPESTDDTTPFFVYESDNDTLEIGLTKKTYLSIFKQSHTYWHEKLVPKAFNAEEHLKDVDIHSLWQIYFMTLGYLISTNENHTIIRVHELVTMKLYALKGQDFLINEFNIITTFVTSRLKRINKSSSLWYLIKKLSIVLIFNDSIGDEDLKTRYNMLLGRVMKSCELHFANYYASNFLRWCIRLNSIIFQTTDSLLIRNSITEIDFFILERIVSCCHEKLSDVSMWSCLEVFLTERLFNVTGAPTRELDMHSYVIEEYNIIAEQISLLSQRKLTSLGKFSPSIPPVSSVEELKLFIEKQFNWLLQANCSIWTPYVSLIRIYEAIQSIESKSLKESELFDELNTKYHKELQILSKLKQKNSTMHKDKSLFTTLLGQLFQKWFT